MTIEIENKPKAFRVVSWPVVVADAQLHLLLHDYTLVSHAFHVVNNEIVFSAFLMSNTIINRQALAAASVSARRQ